MSPVDHQSNASSHAACLRDVEQAARRLERAWKLRAKKEGLMPTLAVVLGSAFGSVADALENPVRVPFGSLPGFGVTSVPGHAGEVLGGEFAGRPVWVLSGRLHYYEGFTLQQVTHPIRVLARLGVRHLILTNAAGTLNRKHVPGTFLLLTDHINFMGLNPVRGWAGGDRFVDLSSVYDEELGRCMVGVARRCKVRLHRGVYLAVSGPSYETPAEIRAFRKWGADAVGMSTVPEAVVARQNGMRVVGLSCLTNWGAGMNPRKGGISHREVLEMSRKCAREARLLLEGFARAIPSDRRSRPA